MDMCNRFIHGPIRDFWLPQRVCQVHEIVASADEIELVFSRRHIKPRR